MTTENTMLKTGCLVFINMNLSSDWHLNTFKSLYWSFQREYPAVQHAVSKFLEEGIMLLCCFPHRQCLTNSSLLCSRQNLKRIKHMCEIDNFKWWQFIQHTLYIHEGCSKSCKSYSDSQKYPGNVYPFRLCSGASILGTHLADSLLISKISVNWGCTICQLQWLSWIWY